MDQIQREKYILAGLRMYGDMLGECCNDHALTDKEREGFEKDSACVELLIKHSEEKIRLWTSQRCEREDILSIIPGPEGHTIVSLQNPDRWVCSCGEQLRTLRTTPGGRVVIEHLRGRYTEE